MEAQGSEAEDGQNGSQLRPLSSCLTLYHLYLKSRLHLAEQSSYFQWHCSNLMVFQGLGFRKAVPGRCLGSFPPLESPFCISLSRLCQNCPFASEGEAAVFPCQLSFVYVCVCSRIVCLLDWVASSVYLFLIILASQKAVGERVNSKICVSCPFVTLYSTVLITCLGVICIHFSSHSGSGV